MKIPSKYVLLQLNFNISMKILFYLNRVQQLVHHFGKNIKYLVILILVTLMAKLTDVDIDKISFYHRSLQ